MVNAYHAAAMRCKTLMRSKALLAVCATMQRRSQPESVSEKVAGPRFLPNRPLATCGGTCLMDEVICGVAWRRRTLLFLVRQAASDVYDGGCPAATEIRCVVSS